MPNTMICLSIEDTRAVCALSMTSCFLVQTTPRVDRQNSGIFFMHRSTKHYYCNTSSSGLIQEYTERYSEIQHAV